MAIQSIERAAAILQALGSGPQPFQIAARLLIPDQKLQPEGDRLGMHAMGAADLHGVLEFHGPALEDFLQTR